MAAVERPADINAARPSFLEAVLSNAGQVEMTDIKKRILDVTQNVSQLKLRVHDYMRSKYVDFDPLMKKQQSYLDKAEKTSDEINALFNRIEFQTKHDLANSTGELRSLHSSLKEASAVLSVTTELAQMEALLKGVEDARNNTEYVTAAKSIQSLQKLLVESSKEAQQLDIYRGLQIEFQCLYGNFFREMSNILSSFISWESSDAANNVVKCTIKLKADNQKEMQEVMQALHSIEALDPWMNTLRKFFLRSVLIPLIDHEASVKVKDSETDNNVQITVNDTEKYNSIQVAVKTSSRKPHYLSTLDNLTKCFEFLHDELDIQFENGDSFIGLLGQGISTDFTDTLIKKCLKEIVPSNHAEQVKLSSIQERVSLFNTYMVGIEFLSEENCSLKDYVQNIEELCAGKACQKFLETAREIMKKDLQDMVEVGPQTPAMPLSATLDSTETVTDTSILMQESLSNIAIKPESELNPNLFQFPKCYVSKSTLEILDLVSSILTETIGDSKENGLAKCFINTAKSVFEIYVAVVPHFHDNLLKTIPQQAALFHNNCMLLAHRLTVLGLEIQSSFPEVPVTFVEYTLRLRHLGSLTFLKQMQQQRKQILDLVKESGLATLGENSELSPDTERTLRQCLRQLELLQTVWQKVLPGDIYSKSIGVLANAFVEELTVRVVSVEDIPANTAVQLSTLFKMVLDRIPELFESGSKVELYVKHWLQFQELITILNASLRDIEERWGDGKGLLAHQFTAEQVKQLIRALFQNTSRRAEVLAKIK